MPQSERDELDSLLAQKIKELPELENGDVEEESKASHMLKS